jgi:hypothetical protein
MCLLSQCNAFTAFDYVRLATTAFCQFQYLIIQYRSQTCLTDRLMDNDNHADVYNVIKYISLQKAFTTHAFIFSIYTVLQSARIFYETRQ